MLIGLVGLPLAGKTTLFNLLTGSDLPTGPFSGGGVNTGMADVPDRRIDYLSSLYKPRKTVYARIQFKDIPGVQSGAGPGAAGKFLEEVRTADLLVQVVRAFASDEVPHISGTVDPMRDVADFQTELLLADMGVIERRIERIKGGKKPPKTAAVELDVLQRYLAALEAERPVSSVELSEEEAEVMTVYNFLTEKPVILAVNLDEEQLRSGTYPRRDELKAYAGERGFPVVEVSAQVEKEINELLPEDRAEFMADLGLSESGLARLARVAYDYLGLISFFTVGEDEVRAWTIRKGTAARRAAGKVHSDIERGFIRAEVFHYDDLYELGSPAKVKEKGLFRLEGKEYVVKDGDIINFRFNV
ncbi:redox-regulated ATPase YchF [Desulforudis sp. 1088]|uniref:redox-regulated ATPase YchF n=1 Tax=unclassified Candidatus Desulforudis TaxID=2635950 RepID=UPI003CE50E3F